MSDEDTPPGDDPQKPKRTARGSKSKRDDKSGARKKRENRSAPRTPAHARATHIPDDAPAAKSMHEIMEDAKRAAQKERIVEVMADKALTHVGAARECQVDRKTVWRWRKEDPAFEQACTQAYEDGTARLKDKASAIVMGDEPSTGSDHLLITVIRSRDPSWRDPKFAPPVNNGPAYGLGTAVINLDDPQNSDLENQVIRKMAARQAAAAKGEQKAPAR